MEVENGFPKEISVIFTSDLEFILKLFPEYADGCLMATCGSSTYIYIRTC